MMLPESRDQSSPTGDASSLTRTEHPGATTTPDGVERLLGRRPSKVIAAHVTYHSRATQRGAAPEAPSFFVIPPSSLTTHAPDADAPTLAEAPAGCQIFAFEGEIALVVGRTLRRADRAAAWDAIAAVTAANDLGVYDLRWADGGSNLRSKGGDGFTPLGPALIDARTVDPTALRIRTWLDGTLVQSADTSDLIFDLPTLVSDISQLVSLEPGDVVVTGTPAGASTLEPGQLVEVEVDSPDTGASTGRLRSTVRVGDWSLPSYSAPPRPTAAQRAQASGERATLDPALRARLASVSVATLASQLRKHGIDRATIDGVAPLEPGARIIGRARTLRYLPGREDLVAQCGGGYNAQKRAFDSLGPGDVLVVDAGGVVHAGTLGDILAQRAHVAGAEGIVTDGPVRDSAEIRRIGIPTFSAGSHPSVLGRHHVPWEHDTTVACGGTTVAPGDVVVADDDGVVVVPPDLADEISRAAVEQEREERFIAEQVALGAPVRGLYPMDRAWRERYESTGSGRDVGHGDGMTDGRRHAHDEDGAERTEVGRA